MIARLSRAWSRLNRLLGRGVRALPAALCDLVGFAGAGLISYGAWLIYVPAGFLVGGILLMAFSMLVGRRLTTDKP